MTSSSQLARSMAVLPRDESGDSSSTTSESEWERKSQHKLIQVDAREISSLLPEGIEIVDVHEKIVCIEVIEDRLSNLNLAQAESESGCWNEPLLPVVLLDRLNPSHGR